MAALAERLAAVQLHQLAHGQALEVDVACRLLERRDVHRRRRRYVRAEHVLQNPHTASHGRGSVRLRRDEQDAAMAEDPLAASIGDCHPAELAAEDPRDTVVLREPLVDER